MNALRVLMAHHDRIEALLVDLRQAAAQGSDARNAALQSLTRLLRRHLEIEESIFYPAVSPRLILVGAARFLHEHGGLRELLERLEASTAPGGPDFERAYEALHEVLVAHVGDEEVELFPEVKRRFSVDELDDLGLQIERADQGEAEPPPERAEVSLHHPDQPEP